MRLKGNQTMPSQMQRVRSGQSNYKDSPLAKRNTALRRAADLSPVKVSFAGVQRLITAGRITTVFDYCQSGEVMGAQVDKDREPFLLVEDFSNPGEFATVSIHDCRIDAVEKRSGKCWITVHSGELLVDVDTAVYWK